MRPSFFVLLQNFESSSRTLLLGLFLGRMSLCGALIGSSLWLAGDLGSSLGECDLREGARPTEAIIVGRKRKCSAQCWWSCLRSACVHYVLLWTSSAAATAATAVTAATATAVGGLSVDVCKKGTTSRACKEMSILAADTNSQYLINAPRRSCVVNTGENFSFCERRVCR